MASRRTTDPSGRRSDQHASLKFLCLKTLLEYVEMPKAAEVRALAGEHPDTSITVIVAPWERGPGSAPALTAPQSVDREEAEPRMNSTLPTVPLDDERRERLVAAAKAMLEQAVYEIPPQPAPNPSRCRKYRHRAAW